MRVNRLPPFGLDPAREAGTFAVLSLPIDLGGMPGTAAGAHWLGERLANPEVAALVRVPYAVANTRCDVPFGRLEPSLYSAAITLQAWRAGYRPLWLFGDHGLGYGLVRAAGLFDRQITVFMLDAHYDRLDRLLATLGRTCAMRDEIHQGNVATWVGRDPCVRRLVQIGPRQSVTIDQLDPLPSVTVISGSDIARDFNAALATVSALLIEAIRLGDLIVLSLDVDVLDPAVNPAVDHREPGGLTLAETLQFATLIGESACAIDVSELNPLRDEQERGCRNVLALLCSILGSATPKQAIHAWHPVLGRPPSKPLRALGPYTHAIVRRDEWREPTGAEVAILEGADTPKLTATFTESALRSAIAELRDATAVTAFASTSLATPSKRLRPTDRWSVDEHHVECLAVSSDRTALAAAGWDHAVYIWSTTDSSRVPIRLHGHEAWVVASAFAPGADRLATVSDDKSLRIWTLTGEVLICRGHSNWVKAVAWRPDSRRIASGGFDGTIGLWDAATGECLHFFRGHPDAIWSLSWSHNGEVLASAGERGLVRLWHAESAAPIGELRGHVGAVERCRFTASGSIVSLNRSGQLLVHDPGIPDPTRCIDTGLEQTLDLCLLEAEHLLLIAGPRTVRCLRADTFEAKADLSADFPVSAVVGWRNGIVAGGDGGSLTFYEFPEG